MTIPIQRQGPTSSEEWYKEWKTIDGSREDTRIAAYDVLFKGMLEKQNPGYYKNFILFEDNIPEDTKIIANITSTMR